MSTFLRPVGWEEDYGSLFEITERTKNTSFSLAFQNISFSIVVFQNTTFIYLLRIPAYRYLFKVLAYLLRIPASLYLLRIPASLYLLKISASLYILRISASLYFLKISASLYCLKKNHPASPASLIGRTCELERASRRGKVRSRPAAPPSSSPPPPDNSSLVITLLPGHQTDLKIINGEHYWWGHSEELSVRPKWLYSERSDQSRGVIEGRESGCKLQLDNVKM